MSRPFKWAFVGDLQIPYEDKRAVALWFKVMKSWKPDAIDIVGDIDDQLEYSTFSDGTTDEFFSQVRAKEKDNEKAVADYHKQLAKIADKYVDEAYPEDIVIPDAPVLETPTFLPFIKENADGAAKFYEKVRDDHPDADIHNSLGNHDIRIFKYLNKKAPEVIDTVTPEFLWGLDNLGITWRHYEEKPFERFAGVHVHHGATTLDTGLAVRGDIEKYGISLVRGHDHRGGVVYKTYPLAGRAHVGMGCGHMCDPNQYGLRYTINPAWELGFGLAHVIDGMALMQFIPITPNYECVVDGKLFKG